LRNNCIFVSNLSSERHPMTGGVHEFFAMTAAYQLPLPLPGRRDRRRRPPPPLERRTHIAVADLLRIAARPGWIFSHIANGEHRSPATAALLQRMGVRPGLFDFMLIGPDGQHFWLELKRGRSPLSPAQERFRQELVDRSVTHGVARSFDEAVATLREWGVLRPLKVQ
jgi:hypothetical protein